MKSALRVGQHGWILNEGHELSTLALQGKLAEKRKSKQINKLCNNTALHVRKENPSAGVLTLYWWV